MTYELILKTFLNQGYKPSFFLDSPPKMNALILRHDVDFDVKYAYQLSLIEDKLKIQASYFFLLHSKSYNLLESKNIEMINSMIKRGHSVSIHFDPTIYNNIEDGLKKEIKIFEMVFHNPIRFISIHRPSEFFLNNSDNICGVRHTYQPTYFSDVKYFADSQGNFRFGNPIDSKEFKENKTIQLLIHPIWWVTTNKDPISKLNEFLEYRIKSYQNHMGRNCSPYEEHLISNTHKHNEI